MMITGFILAHLTMLAVVVGYAMPRYYDALVPADRRGEGTEPTVAMQTRGEVAGRPIGHLVDAERGVGNDGDSIGSDKGRAKK